MQSDAPTLSLDGDWRFRLLPTHRGLDTAVADPGLDDAGWDTIAVPSHWALANKEADGTYGQPIYTNIAYPFPVDPPYVPDENPTGDYRRHFTCPEWATGPMVGTVLLRFDGVESVYRVGLNGVEVGIGKGSRLVQELIDEELPVLESRLSSSVKVRESHDVSQPLIHCAPGHKLTEEFGALYEELEAGRRRKPRRR